MIPKALFGNIETLLTSMSEDVPPKSIVAGDPQTHYAELISKDGLDVGVWQCTVGSWTIDSYSVDEVMLLLSGKMRLTDSFGKATELAKGDLFFIPKGWQGRWDVVETMQKVYVILSGKRLGGDVNG